MEKNPTKEIEKFVFVTMKCGSCNHTRTWNIPLRLFEGLKNTLLEIARTHVKEAHTFGEEIVTGPEINELGKTFMIATYSFYFPDTDDDPSAYILPSMVQTVDVEFTFQYF